MTPRSRIHQRISVAYDYPVTFTRDVFGIGNPVLAESLTRLNERRVHRALVFLESRVAAAVPHASPDRIRAYFAVHAEDMELAAGIELIEGGEPVKNDRYFVERAIARMLELRLDRQSFVIAIGGGAALDAVGFAASLVHRGLRMVRVPTTVLAQNDGGVGVKTAVNLGDAKNALGTFAPPFAVINDFDFIRALPKREWRDGIAEAFKVAIIQDRDFFEFLSHRASELNARDEEAMEQLIVRCAELHLDHIRTSGDPFELGRARPLDFGHWSAHKLEIMSRHRSSHGQAVALGVALDSCYARYQGWLTEAEFMSIHAGLSASGFALWCDEFETREASGERAIYAGLDDFQEHLGGELCITFPVGIGGRHEVHEVDIATMERALETLRSLRGV